MLSVVVPVLSGLVRSSSHAPVFGRIAMTDKTRQWFLVALLLGAMGLVHWLTLRPGHEWGGDFAMYVGCAANLAEGRPYGATGYIYNPAYPTVGPPTYPPGCSLLLAPVYMLFGPNLEAMKLVMVASMVAFLLFVFLCVRRELPFGWSLAIVVLVGGNRVYLGNANTIGSDLPFMAILYLTILLIQKAYDTPGRQRPRWRFLFPAALMIFVAFATRTVGALLLPSLLVYDLVRYRRITLWAVLVGVVFVVLAFGQSMLVHSDSAYLDQYNVSPSIFLANALGYVKEMAGFWHNGYFKPLGGFVFLAVTALAVLGYVESVRRRITILEVFPVLYLAAVLLFPGYAGRRYLQPVFPIYLLFAVRGLSHAWLLHRERVRRVVFASLAVAVVASYLASYTRLQLEVTEGVSKPTSVALFNFVRNRTSEDDVIVFIKPRVMALYTSRKSSAYHTPSDDAQLWDYFRRIGATYLVVVDNQQAMATVGDPQRVAYLRQFARRNADRLQLVFTNADFSVYHIAGPGGDLAGNDTTDGDSPQG